MATEWSRVEPWLNSDMEEWEQNAEYIRLIMEANKNAVPSEDGDIIGTTKALLRFISLSCFFL